MSFSYSALCPKLRHKSFHHTSWEGAHAQGTSLRKFGRPYSASTIVHLYLAYKIKSQNQAHTGTRCGKVEVVRVEKTYTFIYSNTSRGSPFKSGKLQLHILVENKPSCKKKVTRILKSWKLCLASAPTSLYLFYFNKNPLPLPTTWNFITFKTILKRQYWKHLRRTKEAAILLFTFTHKKQAAS